MPIFLLVLPISGCIANSVLVSLDSGSLCFIFHVNTGLTFYYYFPFQIQELEREIKEKTRQMRVFERRMLESGESSGTNASLVDMQQVN